LHKLHACTVSLCVCACVCLVLDGRFADGCAWFPACSAATTSVSSRSALCDKLCTSLLCDVTRLRRAVGSEANVPLRLIVLTPRSPSHVFRATWDNVVAFAASLYPDIAGVLTANLPALKASSFHQLEAQWQRDHGLSLSFREAAQDSGSRASVASLRAIVSPTAADVRYFLYCVLRVGSTFVGDGWLYDSLGRVSGEEWLAQNAAVEVGTDCYIAHISSRLLLNAEPVFQSPTAPRARARTSVEFNTPPQPQMKFAGSQDFSDITRGPSSRGGFDASRSSVGAAGGVLDSIQDHPFLSATVSLALLGAVALFVRRRS
jgi:hypothetical protein